MIKMTSRDAYECELSMSELILLIHNQKWHLYHILQEENKIYFEAPLSEYFKISKHPQVRYLKTSGIAGYIRRFLSYKRNWLTMLVFVLSFFVYSHLIWEVKIQGEGNGLIQELSESLKEEGIYPYAFLVSTKRVREVEEHLKQQYFKQIEWLNLEYSGDALIVRFMPRKEAIRTPLGYEPLIAMKEAVVAYFEVENGKKLVKINDYVKVGDILVSADLLDSLGKPKRVYVRGSVYGYTMQEVEAELKWPYEIEMSKPFAYFRLLFHLRGEISKVLGQNEHIVKENILHFSHSEGTISMKIQYTLYEDITKP